MVCNLGPNKIIKHISNLPKSKRKRLVLILEALPLEYDFKLEGLHMAYLRKRKLKKSEYLC